MAISTWNNIQPNYLGRKLSSDQIGTVVSSAAVQWSGYGLSSDQIARGIAVMDAESGLNFRSGNVWNGVSHSGYGQFDPGTMQAAANQYYSQTGVRLNLSDYATNPDTQIKLLGAWIQKCDSVAISQHSDLIDKGYSVDDVSYAIHHQGIYASSANLEKFLNSDSANGFLSGGLSDRYHADIDAAKQVIAGGQVDLQLRQDAVVLQIQQERGGSLSDAKSVYLDELNTIIREGHGTVDVNSALEVLQQNHGVSGTPDASAIVKKISDAGQTEGIENDMDNGVSIASEFNDGLLKTSTGVATSSEGDEFLGALINAFNNAERPNTPILAQLASLDPSLQADSLSITADYDSLGVLQDVTANATNIDGTVRETIDTTYDGNGGYNENWTDGNGNSGSNQQTDDGSTFYATYYADGSQVFNNYYASTGEHETDQVAADGFETDSMVTPDGSGGYKHTWIDSNGNAGEDDIASDGNTTYSSRTTVDADGNSTQAWTSGDGSHGENITYANGNTSSTTTYADGGTRIDTVDASTGLHDDKTLLPDGGWIDYQTTYDENGGYNQNWTDSNGNSGSSQRTDNGDLYNETDNADGSQTFNNFTASTGVWETDQITADGFETDYLDIYDNNGGYTETWTDSSGRSGENDVTVDDNGNTTYTSSTVHELDGSSTQSWASVDGSHGESTTFVDGSESSNVTNADGSTYASTTTIDSDGDTSTAWTASNGSSGLSIAYVNGNTSSSTQFADGSTDVKSFNVSTNTEEDVNTPVSGISTDTVIVRDSNGGYTQTWTSSDGGYGFKQQADTGTFIQSGSGYGAAVYESWTKGDGSSGTSTTRRDGWTVADSTYADGSTEHVVAQAGGNSESKINYADGSNKDTITANNGQVTYEKQVFADGSGSTQTYTTAGVKTSDTEVASDGSSVSTQYAPDGLVSSETVTDSHGNFVTDYANGQQTVGTQTESNGVVTKDAKTYADDVLVTEEITTAPEAGITIGSRVTDTVLTYDEDGSYTGVENARFIGSNNQDYTTISYDAATRDYKDSTYNTAITNAYGEGQEYAVSSNEKISAADGSVQIFHTDYYRSGAVHYQENASTDANGNTTYVDQGYSENGSQNYFYSKDTFIDGAQSETWNSYFDNGHLSGYIERSVDPTGNLLEHHADYDNAGGMVSSSTGEEYTNGTSYSERMNYLTGTETQYFYDNQGSYEEYVYYANGTDAWVQYTVPAEGGVTSYNEVINYQNGAVTTHSGSDISDIISVGDDYPLGTAPDASDDGGSGNCTDGSDPIVLNLTGQQVQTVGLRKSTATFDMQNNGQQVLTGWVTAGEGLLVLDPDNSNTVTQDANLVQGFAALTALDSNNDGVLNSSDASWNELKVWVDTSGTGDVATASLYTLDQLNIASIDLHATSVNQNSNGNTILDDSTFQMKDGTTGDIAGVNFVYSTSTSLDQLIQAMATFAPEAAASTSLAHPANDPMVNRPLLAAAH